LLADNISKVPFLELVSSCHDPFSAIEVLQDQSIDLIFIDIQMPGMTGLQFIESLVNKPIVILITAYKQYALEGYNLDVVDYLVKPVSLDRFVKACNKARELFMLRHKSNSFTAEPGYMFVNAAYSMVKVVFNDIVYIEGLKDYVQIHLKSTPKTLVVRGGIKAMLGQLPGNLFIQVHKSFILSVNSITSIRKNSVFIHENEFSIGDAYKEKVQGLLS
jgi:two-component system, LytTR family, response regulator